jgi:hypothetical protein
MWLYVATTGATTQTVGRRAAEATEKKWNVSGTHYRIIVEAHRHENEGVFSET